EDGIRDSSVTGVQTCAFRSRHWGRNDLNLFSNFKWVRSPARWLGAGRGMRVPSGPLLVIRTGAAGLTERRVKAPDADAHQTPEKVLVDIDSRTVAMEVGIRYGVCNNSPAESPSPENGWRWSVGPIPGRRRQERGLSGPGDLHRDGQEGRRGGAEASGRGPGG